MTRRDPLERVAHERPGAPLRLRLRLLLGHADHAREIVADELLGALEHLALRIGHGEAPDALELRELRVVGGRQLRLELAHARLARGELLLLRLELAEPPDDVLLLRRRALLGLDHLGAAIRQLRLHVGPRAQRLLAHLDLRLAADRFGAALRLVQASRDLRVGGGATPPEREPGPHQGAHDEAGGHADQTADDNQHSSLPRPACGNGGGGIGA